MTSEVRAASGARAIAFAIQLYRWVLSPLLPAACRFYPSCSQYTQEALLAHGVVRGSWLALRRLIRCHPWRPGGVDLVPRGRRPGQPDPMTG